jgi:hypothetical protein
VIGSDVRTDGGPARHRPAPNRVAGRGALLAALFVLYLWAFAYLTDLPLTILGSPSLPLGLAALALALAGAAWMAARGARAATRGLPAAAGAAAAAALTLLASAAAHDAARSLLYGLPPEATLRGVPMALLYAGTAFALAFAILWATGRLIDRRLMPPWDAP